MTPLSDNDDMSQNYESNPNFFSEGYVFQSVLDFFGYLVKGISFNKMFFIFLWDFENGKKHDH